MNPELIEKIKTLQLKMASDVCFAYDEYESARYYDSPSKNAAKERLGVAADGIHALDAILDRYDPPVVDGLSAVVNNLFKQDA